MDTHPWSAGFEWQRPPGPPIHLSEQQIDQYHRDGWLIVTDVVDSDTIAGLTKDFDAIDLAIEQFLKSQPDGRVFIAESGAITFAPHVVNQSDVARRVSQQRSIAEICHDLVGADVRLYWDQLVYKKPEKPREFPWHQDNGYTFIDPQQYLTVWLALTDAPVEAGCPWVVPGPHLNGTLEHEFVEPLGFRCFERHPDAVAASVKAGSAVIFSSLTPHMTGPNLTDSVRKTYILQYAPDGAELLEGDPNSGDAPKRVLQNDAGRQYSVVSGGVVVIHG